MSELRGADEAELRTLVTKEPCFFLTSEVPQCQIKLIWRWLAGWLAGWVGGCVACMGDYKATLFRQTTPQEVQQI